MATRTDIPRTAKTPSVPVIIQIDRPGRVLDMSAVRALLESTGIQLDLQYGPILINLRFGRYVVRGEATDEQRARAERIAGVRLFSDVQQKPLVR